MTLKEELFEMYEMDNSTHALYNTLKLIGVTEKGKDTKQFLREYQVWKQII